jgi:transposase
MVPRFDRRYRRGKCWWQVKEDHRDGHSCLGIDLGKTTFHLVALGHAGKMLLRKKFTQRQLVVFTASMSTSLIGLEACAGAHFLGRIPREQGHNVKLIPAQFVRPFVKSNKNDFLDAEAIAEARMSPSVVKPRFVRSGCRKTLYLLRAFTIRRVWVRNDIAPLVADE